jgi:hypothetical protein
VAKAKMKKKKKMFDIILALATAEEFTYEIKYLDGDAVDNLQNSVALSLIRIQRETASGLVILVLFTGSTIY